MIDEETTFREKGYYSTDLSYGSNKLVWAICEGEDCQREGGRGRWIQFRQYHDLCYWCAINVPCREKCKTPTEKLDYIDDDITFAEKGYRSTDLKSDSQKLVWCVCANTDCEREGGRGRWLKFQKRSKLCNLCSVKTDECSRIMSENHADFSGENNPNWQGGLSFEPYCEKFNNSFRESVREKFGRVCFMCPTTEEENRRKLSVHHVSYDKECMCNGVDCEFVTLCNKCHSKTNFGRELWERLIINVLYYEEWI